VNQVDLTRLLQLNNRIDKEPNTVCFRASSAD
jgi:hypothetical protein